jgi:hypothetical protein
MRVSLRAKVEWMDREQRRLGFREKMPLGSAIASFGFEMRWLSAEPLPAVWNADLDAQVFKYADSLRNSFTVGVRCIPGDECAADGDRLNAVIEIANGNGIRTEVSIETMVEALASCDRSRATIRYSEGSAGELLLANEISAGVGRLQVDIWAIDVDGLAILRTAPAMMVEWQGGESLQPAELNPVSAYDSNRFTTAVPAHLWSTAGLFSVRVGLLEGYNSSLGAAGKCILLEQAMVVVEANSGLRMVWVLIGASAGSVVVLAVIFLVIRRTSSKINIILMMLVTEVCTL